MSKRLSLDEVKVSFRQALNSLDSSAIPIVERAFELAEKEHEGQQRKEHSDRPGDRDLYIIHPMRVSLVLMNEIKIRDVTSIAAAVLHDVVEDGNSRPSLDHIRVEFGSEIATTVGFLTKPEIEHEDAEKLRPYHESFFVAPLHVRLVKLSDRLDNLRESLLVDRPKFQHRYLHETREVYIPLASQTAEYFNTELTTLCNKLELMLK